MKALGKQVNLEILDRTCLKKKKKEDKLCSQSPFRMSSVYVCMTKPINDVALGFRTDPTSYDRYYHEF